MLISKTSFLFKRRCFYLTSTHALAVGKYMTNIHPESRWSYIGHEM